MSGTTIYFGIALVVLGIAFYVLTGNRFPTSLIPCIFGVLLVVFGKLAETPVAGRRKVYMHVAVTVGLIGLITAVVALFTGKPGLRSPAVIEKAAMAILMLIFVLLSVRSFIAARRLPG